MKQTETSFYDSLLVYSRALSRGFTFDIQIYIGTGQKRSKYLYSIQIAGSLARKEAKGRVLTTDRYLLISCSRLGKPLDIKSKTSREGLVTLLCN